MVGAAMTVGANAATTAYSSDDLFIGFTKAGSTQDYLVDIGQASNYNRNVGGIADNATITLSVGNTDADLKLIFGAGYATDPTVKWGVIGTTHLDTVGTDPAHTIYASNAVGTWNTAASNVLASSDTRIQAVANAYNGKSSTINSSVGLIQNNVSVASNAAYASYQPGGANATGGAAGTSFAYFNPTIQAYSFQNLALNQLQPGTGPASVLGYFSLNSDGAITYTSVPEPTSAALGLLGAVMMVARRRRR